MGFGDSHGPKAYGFIGFGDSHGPKAYEFIGFGDSQFRPDLPEAPKSAGDAGPGSPRHRRTVCPPPRLRKSTISRNRSTISR